MFNNVYKGKTVLVTGHTGFKGSWLTAWLTKLGARVVGVSMDIPTQPAMFEELKLDSAIEHHILDIRDLPALSKVFRDSNPDFLFHLAAQPIVSTSYADPVGTMSSNVMGTTHVMEVLRHHDKPCVAVIITSDKCYDNVEWVWGYKETDAVGGKDIYSGSKGAAELVFKSYFHSFFDADSPVRMATGRAGNVIGGGDWAKDRIVVDCMQAWSENRAVEIRSPSATRPWQHVLEPLSGYLALGAELLIKPELHGESFNFGPASEQNRSVVDLLADLSGYWDFKSADEAYSVTDNIPFHEAGLLKLNCDKALFHMRWQPTLQYPETIRFVSEWYFDFYRKNGDMMQKTLAQLNEYEQIAGARGVIWAGAK
jgi:CDP-glucose 4,6-dehydratase